MQQPCNSVRSCCTLYFNSWVKKQSYESYLVYTGSTPTTNSANSATQLPPASRYALSTMALIALGVCEALSNRMLEEQYRVSHHDQPNNLAEAVVLLCHSSTAVPAVLAHCLLGKPSRAPSNTLQLKDHVLPSTWTACLCCTS